LISKNHRQNHNFQILYFLVGSCHTHDAAYALLQDLREDRAAAINNYKVSKIREKAKILHIKNLLNSKIEEDIIEAEALQKELDFSIEQGIVLYNAAIDEIKFIDECMEKINPYRKYKHLSDPEANQAMQQEEWKLELIKRAENYLLTSGTIPADHFDTMRMHPEFGTNILPEINKIRTMLRTEEGVKNLLESKNKNLLE